MDFYSAMFFECCISSDFLLVAYPYLFGLKSG